jgi:hypothetical protein
MRLGGVDCDVSLYHLNFGLIMYFSYFCLFAHFFHTAYLQKGKADRLKMEEKGKNNEMRIKNSVDLNANFFVSKNPQPVRKMMMKVD